jgi:hypothetical protein
MGTINNSQEQKLGYRFSPPESNHAPGGSRLEVLFNDSPTEHHFDPEKLHLNVKSKTGVSESLTIRHPWVYGHTYQALAGSIELTDRFGRKVEAFTFGGSLKIESQDTLTVCILESPAPILKMSLEDPILMMFIEEIEILFAKQRAALLSKPYIYEKKLVKADPFNLYQASLNTLIDEFEHLHHKGDSHVNEFLNFLHSERKRIKGEETSSHLIPAWEDIF